MSVFQLPSQSHRVGASQTAACIDPCGYVVASISTFLFIIFHKDLLTRECVIVSVCQLPLQSHRQGISQIATGICDQRVKQRTVGKYSSVREYGKNCERVFGIQVLKAWKEVQSRWVEGWLHF